MKILIAQARIVDKRHPDNGQVKDLLIEDGQIAKIADKIDGDVDLTIAEKGLCISIGWMDMRANFRDPGHEHKENLETGIRAAAAGGFTSVGVAPSTHPATDNKGAVEYLLNRSRHTPVELIPIGAISKSLKGESLAEMYDMFRAGARAFGDDKTSIHESGLLQRALLYTKNFGATVMHFPYDASLIPNGQMHEGVFSTQLGIKGVPAIAEEVVVSRDLSLLDYTDGKLHLGPLSAATSVAMVATAREQGSRVTCDVTAAHLAYADESIGNFDSNYKLMPPLRDAANREALIEELAAGRIHVITSDHSPEDEEHKKLEFDYAGFGTAGIESFFSLLYGAVGAQVALDALVATFSIHPREVLNLPVPEIIEGAAANLTLFTTEGHTDFAVYNRKSRAYNFAESGHTLPGKVIGIVHRGQCILRD